MFLSVTGETLLFFLIFTLLFLIIICGFFGFYCYLAALFSSCQQLFFNPSSIYGHWVFPFPNLFQLWLLDPKEGITFGRTITQQMLVVLHHSWGGSFEGRTHRILWNPGYSASPHCSTNNYKTVLQWKYQTFFHSGFFNCNSVMTKDPKWESLELDATPEWGDDLEFHFEKLQKGPCSSLFAFKTQVSF